MRGQDKLQFYYKYNKIFLAQCGLWPYQKVIYNKIIRCFWLFQEVFLLITKVIFSSIEILNEKIHPTKSEIYSLNVILLLRSVKKMIKFYEIQHEIDLVIEGISSFMYNVIVTIKFINGISNEKKIKVILEKIKKDWENTIDPMEDEILTSYANIGKLLNFLYMSAVLSTLVAFMCLPLTPVFLDIILPLNESRPKKPLILAEFFIDEEKYFHSILVHAFFTAYYGIIPLLGADTLYMNCVYHACGMLKILGCRIESSFKETHENEELEKENYQQIKTCIKLHQEIIEFCDDINEAFSKSFFGVLILNITLMSISGISVVINFGDINLINDVIKYGMFTVSQIFHVFSYNYMGQLVLDSGEKIIDNIYNSQWYETSIKTQGLLKFMLLRSLRPNMMQARILLLCLPVFTSVMKSSLSYFTVLRSTR